MGPLSSGGEVDYSLSGKGRRSLLTCDQFLQELNDYLDANVNVQLKRRLESHVSECPSCFAVVDTTQKMMRIYKGVEPKTLPQDVETRLLKALARRCRSAFSR